MASFTRLFWTRRPRLMFLKHYTKLSDEKSLERFNTDWVMQLFCGTLLSDNEMIRDNSFVSSVRNFLGGCVDFDKFQYKIIEHWKDEIPDKNILLEDATCYEVYIGRRTARFPTDVKLLWEACEWLWDQQIPTISHKNKLKVPRSKYKEQRQKYLIYIGPPKRQASQEITSQNKSKNTGYFTLVIEGNQ